MDVDHERHHIFFNPSGFHNHIVHHLLSLYALGASTSSIQMQWNGHEPSQRPPGAVDKAVVEAMHDPSQFRSYLNKQEHYPNFLRFFQQKVEEHGWQTVAREYLLKGDEQANDLLARLFAGFLHPLIHLGFGVEFNQPAIVVEALTQAALHDNYLQPFFLGAEKAAEAKKAEEASKTLPRLLDDIRADKRLSTAAHWDDNNKIRDGILKRASNEMIGYASQWTVDPDSLEEKTAEMINAVVSSL
ncbi:hypothetical protein LTR39_000912 [Cryomyces antarcticus]|nr:hypothetical protein LTR39_000912 [Cryomyces antarcticus]